MLSSGHTCRAGVRINLDSSFSFFFFLASFLPTIFFRFSDLVICGFLVWPDSVRTAAVSRGNHVPFYSSISRCTVNNVRFTVDERTPDERVQALSSLFLCFFSFRFVFRFFGRVTRVDCCPCSYSIFHSIPNIYPGTCFWLSKLPKLWRTFFFGRPQKNPGYLRPTSNTLYQVTPREQ